MLRTLSKLSRPYLSSHKSLHRLPYTLFSNNSSPDPDDQPQKHPKLTWNNFPLLPILSQNAKIVTFFLPAALSSFFVPEHLLFDVAGLGLAVFSLGFDLKYLQNPNTNYRGIDLTPRNLLLLSTLNSCLLTYGVMGEYYLVASFFSLFCYFGLMASYRGLTMFKKKIPITKKGILLAGSTLSTLGAGMFTELSDIAPGLVVDPTNFMYPIYFGMTYGVGSRLLEHYKEANRLGIEETE
jgi:hypothetical protein